MKYICIHGHFYQPPREDPITGDIKVQPTAAPFLNWNHRITEECYAANLKAEIWDESGTVLQVSATDDHITFKVENDIVKVFLGTAANPKKTLISDEMLPVSTRTHALFPSIHQDERQQHGAVRHIPAAPVVRSQCKCTAKSYRWDKSCLRHGSGNLQYSSKAV